jgi:hypothetical protein
VFAAESVGIVTMLLIVLVVLAIVFLIRRV